MKVIQYSEPEATEFNGDIVKDVKGRVVIGKDDGAENFCMRVFTVAPGGFTPKHTHEWEHEIFVHQGEGLVFREGNYQKITAGSVIFVPGMEEHHFKNEGDEDLVFVCLIPKGAPEL